jgi:tripartite-type tricarboxylate transporter receptor subunit TctC
MQFCFRVVALFACLVLAGASAQAQTYPSKPVRIVVPLPAGGAVDTIIRAVGQRLSDIWGQQVVIENKSGANTQIGTETVARSAPDGYTLLATAETTFVVNPYLYPKLSYAASDFVPVIGIGRADQALNVHASVPANSIAGVIAMAKARPGEINYGSIGIGSSSHLNTVLFEMMAGIKLTPVHYRGGAPAITDLVGGHIPMLFISFPSVKEHVNAGRIKMLGVGSSKRLASMPDVPAIAETVPGFEAFSWFGLFAPAATPKEIVAKINADVQRVYASEEFKQNFLALYAYQTIVSSPAEFADYVKKDAARWEKVIKDANVKVE